MYDQHEVVRSMYILPYGIKKKTSMYIDLTTSHLKHEVVDSLPHYLTC
jgi:hypothetical protein